MACTLVRPKKQENKRARAGRVMFGLSRGATVYTQFTIEITGTIPNLGWVCQPRETSMIIQQRLRKPPKHKHKLSNNHFFCFLFRPMGLTLLCTGPDSTYLPPDESKSPKYCRSVPDNRQTTRLSTCTRGFLRNRLSRAHLQGPHRIEILEQELQLRHGHRRVLTRHHDRDERQHNDNNKEVVEKFRQRPRYLFRQTVACARPTFEFCCPQILGTSFPVPR